MYKYLHISAKQTEETLDRWSAGKSLYFKIYLVRDLFSKQVLTIMGAEMLR